MKRKNPLVSIIITYYNLGKFIEEAIFSCLNQTYNNIEILLVNDGSNEKFSLKKLQIIKIKYANKIIFIDQNNRGVGSARNNGIKNSNGEFIICLDADDKLDKNYVSLCVKKILNNNKNIGFVTTYVKFFGKENFIWKTSDYNYIRLLSENVVHVSSLFRKKTLEKIGGYSEKGIKGYEDWDLWISIAEKGYKWTVIKKPLFFYRKRGKSLISKGDKIRLKNIEEIINKHQKTYKKNFKNVIINLNKYLLSYSNNEKRQSLDNKKTTKDKNIAILLGSPNISGGTYVIFKHALALQQYGYQITIVTEHPFEINRLNWFPQAKQLRFISLKDAASQLYDLCLATWWKTVFFLPQIKTRKSAYFVQSIESKFCRPSERQLKEIIDFTYQLPFYFLTEAHWIQRYLQEIHHQSALLALNGIDKTVFKPSGETVDRSRPLGPRILVEGALGVFFKQTEAAVDVANKSGCRDIWLLTPTKIDKFPGTTRTFSQIPFAQVSSIMRSCDLILKLSKVEGMFGPPLEMMHCGGTAVTFDVTGYDEYLKDGINSLVYPMDNFAAVIDGLSKLLKDPSYLSILKNNALNTAKKWPDWSISSSQFIKNIQTILDDTSLQPTISINQAISSAVGISGPAYSALFHPLTIKETARLLVDKIAQKTTGLFLGQKSLATHYDYKHYPLKFTSEKI